MRKQIPFTMQIKRNIMVLYSSGYVLGCEAARTRVNEKATKDIEVKRKKRCLEKNEGRV